MMADKQRQQQQQEPVLTVSDPPIPLLVGAIMLFFGLVRAFLAQSASLQLPESKFNLS
jgi:hypothetical protein